MPLSHLIITPMPRGIANGKLRLSVYFAPRLREGGGLNSYPAFANWTQNVIDWPLEMSVFINGTQVGPSDVTPVPLGGMALNPDAWDAIFGPTIGVQPANFVDRSGANVLGMDAAQLSSYVEQIVSALAQNNGTPLTKGALQSAFPDLTAFAQSVADYHGQVGNGLEAAGASSYDFHSILRMLTAHPALLRVLGLVRDVEVTLPPGPLSTLWVRTNWATEVGAAPQHEVPLRYDFTSGGSSALREGDFLRLGDVEVYAVNQVELGQAARELAGLVKDIVDPEVPSSSLVEIPAFVETGIGIIQRDTAAILMARFARQRNIEDGIDNYVRGITATAPVVIPEDYTSGYRIDVRTTAPQTSVFRSLHQRTTAAGYEFPADPALTIVPPPDEGWSTVALSTDGTAELSAPFITVPFGEVNKRERTDNTAWRAADQFVVWGGWSLSTPKPSRSTTGDGTAEARDDSRSVPEISAELEVNYRHISGTLPVLRYGTTYQLRARCVDFGGRGPELADNGPAGTTSPPVTFGRLTPVAPPTVVRRSSRPDPGVGDMPDTLVIKSELNQLPATILAASRFLFPPAVNQSLVERHGLPNGGNDPAAYTDLAARDATSLAAQVLADPETDEPVAGAAIVAGQVTPGPLQPAIGYLPDPVATTVAFHGLPQQGTANVEMDYGTWPTYTAVLLDLRGGTTAPVTAPATQVVTTFLPPGTTTTCRVSHAPDASLVDHMKAYQLADPAPGSALEVGMLAGRNEAITPSRTITLVHAVRVPIVPPSFPVSVPATRTAIGQTTATIEGTVGVHRATTDHLAFRVEWTDPVDRLDEPAPGTTTGKMFVADVTVDETGAATTAVVGPMTIDLGDTKRRDLIMSSEAFCRYSRYFTEEKAQFLTTGSTLVLNTKGISAPSLVVTKDLTGDAYVEGTDYTVDAKAGSIRFLAANAMIKCRFIPLPVSRRSAESTVSKSVSVAVPNSTPPAPPVVHSIVPAFQRTITSTRSRIKVVHDGRVVRVALERPWYSSGAHEALAVATGAGFTQWGRDPLSIGGTATSMPARTAFSLSTETRAAVDGLFDVASHGVTFDPTRGMWISDILVNATFGYRPWVQLHLARYQSLAVEGAHVSTTVATEPIRLGERRTVTVERLKNSRVSVKVTGRDNNNRMKVTLQRSDKAIKDPLLRWTDVSSAFLTRTGTRPRAVHSGKVSTKPSGTLRLVIEDFERVSVDGGSALKNDFLLVYREVVNLPKNW
jgi:hypothetical protein